MARQPGKVRVTSQGSTFELKKPVLTADTLRARSENERQVVIPISSVDSLWVQRNNRKTSRIVAITTTAIVATFAIAAAMVPGKKVY